MITASELQAELAHCHCSESHYQHWLGIRYTEGVKTLAEKGESFWLLDAIASYQRVRLIKYNPNLQEFQLWLLTVNDDHSAVLACYEDSPSTCSPVITQDIPFTDFVLPEIKLYVEYGVVLLPSEH
ncbi:DUF6876 family protein [Acaryochloris marina]|uniref:DUF6876 domain-containing protein n=1 Tax=Acaryochloris marina (strain MBIC 11017) TaxID=329726 RepID=A8ZLB0_ACAM1|nr:DUF6876 family protein [Acaryochloris marina]ABW31937.1 hypothetical protein AM1_B0217 [Acaryochloris marina MBIC11017]BDM82904.1 hypothetical protein AM10699_57650 [Acaryochloris marina MBIC10699]